LTLLLGLPPATPGAEAGADEAVALPPGVKAVWDTDLAVHETTPTRERVCLNGLWRWQPAARDTSAKPAVGWGWFKVPGCWPGMEDYLQHDYQTVFAHPAWRDTKLGQVKSAWYERTFTVPASWAGRRILLELEYVNSFATVYVDGKQVGEARFPASRVDLTDAAPPGTAHTLSLLVVAMPLRAVMESYTDTNAARQRQGKVDRRGLCGDVWLASEPAGPRLGGVQVGTSVRRKEITFDDAVSGLPPGGRFHLQARIREGDHSLAEFAGPPFAASDTKGGRASFTAAWLAPKLWDLDTPGNQYEVDLSLVDDAGKTLDTAAPARFGFREFWVQGRDFYLNGTRLFLSLIPLDNAQVGAACTTYEAARETLLRMKSFGINFVYTHNYDCEPGAHLSFAEILRAADDTGMLVALSQPHFSAYDWKGAEADQSNGYAGHAAFYTGVAGTHPAVVCYAMSHNATGYNEDTNPAKMTGAENPRDPWAGRNAGLALRCEAIVNQLDPWRIVYHHSSGDLSALYTLNFYLNFVPPEELDDWFQNWSEAGVKPMVLVEYGVPFGWDWAMYRGWYAGKREFGSAAVPWEYCLAEWNAQFLGDSAYQIGDRERRNLRWEAAQFRRSQGKGWYRWDYPTPLGDARFAEMQPVQEAYTTENWRAFRGWGLSGNSPWEHDRFWVLRDGFEPRRRELPVDWEHLQRPGISPDYIDRTYATFDLAYDRQDWLPTPTALSLMRNNMPLLGWIAGKSAHFTARDHLYEPGETVEKQLIVINNSRRPTVCEASWEADLPVKAAGHQSLTIETGVQQRVPLRIPVPGGTPPGSYHLTASFRYANGETQTDSFAFSVLPARQPLAPPGKIALFDPAGHTARWLDSHHISARRVSAEADLSGVDLLIIGQAALTLDGAAPSLARVRDGLKVLVFEQTPDVLEKRLGFKVETYGLRQAWPRVAGSPALSGLTSGSLSEWRGESTIVPPTIDYTLNEHYNGAPSVRWCGLEVTRLWRCGNWGSVASALIEKPPCGDFMPLIDGGYALQYSPLLEYREGRGVVLFCQMDVTGRTERDPAAETLTGNLLAHLAAWQPVARRAVLYAGEEAGRKWLAACGIESRPFDPGATVADHVLVAGPGAGAALEGKGTPDWIKRGGAVITVGLAAAEANTFLPTPVKTENAEHIAAPVTAFPAGSPFAGIAPADLHNRDPRETPLVRGEGAVADGVLAAQGGVIQFQLTPWHFATDPEHFNQRRTFQRTSFALARLLGNLGASGSTPLLERFSSPVGGAIAASLVRNGQFAAATKTAALADDWELSPASGGATSQREPVQLGGQPHWAQLLAAAPPAPGARETDTMLAQYNLPIRAGQWYRLSLVSRAEGLKSRTLNCAVQNTGNWQGLIDYLKLEPKAAWTTNTFLVQAKGTAEKGTKFQIWFTGPGRVWLAEASLEPVPDPAAGRWLAGLYLVQPVDWDDPYRFFGW